MTYICADNCAHVSLLIIVVVMSMIVGVELNPGSKMAEKLSDFMVEQTGWMDGRCAGVVGGKQIQFGYNES